MTGAARVHRTGWRIARAAAALLFGTAGVLKLVGIESMVGLFETIGWGQWFRYFTAGVELFGAAMLISRRTAVPGAVMLACVSLGATIVNLWVIGRTPLPALFLLALTVGIASMPIRASHRYLLKKD